jgi:hypothetical protein
MRIRGWVYVIVNEAIPGLVKVGFSTKDPSLRAEELSGSGVPVKYTTAYDALVYDPYEVEQLVHANLESTSPRF